MTLGSVSLRLWQASDSRNDEGRLMPPPADIEVLANEVLGLSPAEREKLLDRVIASLDADRKRDAAWDALAAARDAQIEAGSSEPIAGVEVMTRLRAELT
jgi:Putative addiction module component